MARLHCVCAIYHHAMTLSPGEIHMWQRSACIVIDIAVATHTALSPNVLFTFRMLQVCAVTSLCDPLVLTVSFHCISFTSSECVTCFWARLEMCVGSSSWYLHTWHAQADERRHLEVRQNSKITTARSKHFLRGGHGTCSNIRVLSCSALTHTQMWLCIELMKPLNSSVNKVKTDTHTRLRCVTYLKSRNVNS